MLIRNLPIESRTARELGAVVPGEWHNIEELLALMAEELDLGNRLFLLAHSKKGTSKPTPLKIPRPNRDGRETPPKRQATSEELLATFGAAGVVIQYEPKTDTTEGGESDR